MNIGVEHNARNVNIKLMYDMYELLFMFISDRLNMHIGVKFMCS